ncbi:hydrolase, partial [Aquimarina celericrescens]|nr:hydrolase [Aquimarina celericrescens]
GTGGKLVTGKSGGGNWRYEGGVFWRSPELELNDIGFLRQADDVRQFTEINYLFLKPTKFYRRAATGFNQSGAFDFEGNYNRIQYSLEGDINYV